jgi:GntR family transcriptional regulator
MREPIYSIIASRAEALIRSGEWAPGERLPPERELCRRLDVSRTTLRQALAELEERGLISRHQGRGTFVAHPRVDADLSATFSVGAALRQHDLKLATRVLSVEVVAASRQWASDLGCEPGTSLVRLRRLRMIAADPIALETSYLPLSLFPGLPEADFASRSLYDVLREDYACYVRTATESLEPVVPTSRESALLGVGHNAPALLIRRITVDRSRRPVEVGTALIRGDRCRFLLERRLPEGWPDPVGDLVPERDRRDGEGPRSASTSVDPATLDREVNRAVARNRGEEHA